MIWSQKHADRTTRRLSGASYVLTIPRQQQPVWWWFAGLLLLGLAGAALALHNGSPETRLRAERDALQQQLLSAQESARLSDMKFQQEAATREELVRQVEELNQKLKQVEQELSFFKSHQQRNRAAAAAASSTAAGAGNPSLAPASR